MLVRCLALVAASRAPLGEGVILLDAAGNIAAGRGLSLSDTLLSAKADTPPILRRTLAQWSEVGGVWGVVPPGKPTAFLPPLYPLFLSVFVRLPAGLWVARCAGVLIGSATATLAYATARRWSPASSLVVAVLAVFDPLAAFQSAEISTHCLAAFTALLPVWILSRAGGSLRAALLAGVGCGIAFLARPTAWLLVPLLGCAAWKQGGTRHVIVLTAGAILAVSPWVARNTASLGRPLLFTTNGGRNLWEFNNQKMGPEYLWSEPAPSRVLYDPIRRRHESSVRRADLLPFPSFTTEPEWIRDRLLTARFMGFAQANPLIYADLVGVRITQMLSPWPLHAPTPVRLASALFYIPLLVLACIGAWRAASFPGLPQAIAIFVMLFLGLHALTAAGFVYRGMIAPFLALLAGQALAGLAPWPVARATTTS
ncbi:glycosyltransferase family 39 protein [Candidatus Fermentibacteria bacterium]|nr:glycosyltransferase family 39 protein [Candidatus Fermentibacteria bacterium]